MVGNIMTLGRHTRSFRRYSWSVPSSVVGQKWTGRAHNISIIRYSNTMTFYTAFVWMCVRAVEYVYLYRMCVRSIGFSDTANDGMSTRLLSAWTDFMDSPEITRFLFCMSQACENCISNITPTCHPYIHPLTHTTTVQTLPHAWVPWTCSSTTPFPPHPIYTPRVPSRSQQKRRSTDTTFG